MNRIPPALSSLSRRLLLCALLALSAPALRAQSPITMREHMMYADVTLSHQSSSRVVPGMIDTGASYCIIDSIFAVDSCHIVVGENATSVGNTKGKKIRSFYVCLDSLSLGGVTYAKVRCYVIDLAGKFRHHAPKLIVGGDVLKRDLWGFDLKRYVMTRHEAPVRHVRSTLVWKNHEDYSRAYLNAIFFEGKIAGKKTYIHFDTGSRRNCLRRDLGLSPTREIEREAADIVHPLAMKKSLLYENVAVEMGNEQFRQDFLLDEERGYPCINTDFLQGKTFVLDYPKKRLYILG